MRFKLRKLVKTVAIIIAVVVCLELLFIQETEIGQPQDFPKVKITSPANKRKSISLHEAGLNVSEKIPVNSRTEVKLIILTYMRSGSSFTGDLFNQHPSVFYVYEPLWSIQKHYGHGGPMFFLNKTYTYPNTKNFYSLSSLGTRFVKAFLNCDLLTLDPRTLTQYHFNNSESTRSYYTCLRAHPGILGSIECLPLMFSSCRNAVVTSVKTIRFTMAQARHLIKSDSKVKVVHLVRDPRATLKSQQRVGKFKLNELDQASKHFCKVVLNDLKLGQTVKTQHPGRVLTVRYEDLARQPLEFADKLLAFAKLKMNQKLRQYIWNITSAGLPDNCVICTTRHDSRKTSMKWRLRLNFKSSVLIDKNCGEVYRRLGYLPLPTKQKLVNLTVPSDVDPSKVPGLWV